jgi:hypothetical protein
VALAGFVFTRNLIDFPVYYAAGQSLLSGRTDLYASDFARGAVMDYRYPPFFIVAFAPLSLLPYKAAALLWHLLSTMAISVSVAALGRLIVPSETKRAMVWALAFFAVGPYFVMILHYGNAHLLAIALMFVGFYLGIRRRDVAAATLLALAITVKITPVLALPYFAIKRRFKLVGLVLLMTAALNLTPSFYFGLSRNWELVREWYRHVVAEQEFHETNGPINLSLKGQARRYLTEIDYRDRVDGDTRYAAVNVARLPAGVVNGMWIVVSTAVFAAGLGLIGWSSSKLQVDRAIPERQRIESDGGKVEGLQLGLMICLMLFVGPLTSKIYFVALLWPVVLLASSEYKHTFIRRALVVIAILSSALPLLPGREVQRLLLVAGVDFYLNCSLLGLTAYSVVLERRGTPQSTSQRTPAPRPAKAP